MSDNHSRSGAISRRRFIVSGISATTGLLAKPHVSSQDPIITRAFESATTDELLDHILTPAEPGVADAALVEVLARAGIAVFDDNGTQALVPPASPISPLT